MTAVSNSTPIKQDPLSKGMPTNKDIAASPSISPPLPLAKLNKDEREPLSPERFRPISPDLEEREESPRFWNDEGTDYTLADSDDSSESESDPSISSTPTPTDEELSEADSRNSSPSLDSEISETRSSSPSDSAASSSSSVSSDDEEPSFVRFNYAAKEEASPAPASLENEKTEHQPKKTKIQKVRDFFKREKKPKTAHPKNEHNLQPEAHEKNEAHNTKSPHGSKHVKRQHHKHHANHPHKKHHHKHHHPHHEHHECLPEAAHAAAAIVLHEVPVDTGLATGALLIANAVNNDLFVDCIENRQHDQDVWMDEIYSRVLSKNSYDEKELNKLIKEGFKMHILNTHSKVFHKGTLLHHLAKSNRFTGLIAGLDKEITVVKRGFVNGSAFDPAERDDMGYTPLMWAVRNSSNTMALQLLKSFSKGPYLNIGGKHHNTALHLAVLNGHNSTDDNGVTTFQVVNELVKQGAKVNLPNIYGNTPLHLACARKDVAMIRTLLAAGADPKVKNTHGQRPQDLLELDYDAACLLLKHNSSKDTLDPEEFEAGYKEAAKLFA